MNSLSLKTTVSLPSGSQKEEENAQKIKIKGKIKWKRENRLFRQPEKFKLSENY